MRDIIELCIELDRTAMETYERLAKTCPDPAIRTVFEQMGSEEGAHVGWWSDLLTAWDAGLVPSVYDEEELRTHLRQLRADIGKSVPMDCADHTVEELLTVAARMEFYMLDPAFGELIDLVRPSQRIDVRQAYTTHIMRLVNAIDELPDPASLAHFLAHALSRALRDMQQLSKLATQDPLTGLYNRRGFYGYVRQWSAWATRYGHPISVVIIDVDQFKKINDTYGHPAGDEALKTVAGALREVVRTSDLVGRYGGDEFAVLAPETDRDELVQLMERILVAIRATPVGPAHTREYLTVSVGGAFISDGVAVTPEQLLAAADHALYEAKNAGRDRAGEPRKASDI